MEEIKYRVRSKETKVLVSNSIPIWITPDGRVFIESNAPVFYGNNHVDDIKIREVTDEVIVEFYSSKKDKNGKEIYEGDIVKQKIRATDELQSYNVDPHTYEVIFEDGSFWLSRPYGETRCVQDFANLNEFIGLDKYEIISDIHDNPELLLKKTPIIKEEITF